MDNDDIKKAVREGYANVVKGTSSCCGSKASSCCGGGSVSAESISKSIGYSDEDLKAVPSESNLGLGCGNPVALASLKEGETVVDLGSGAGFDCFLASPRVGAKGKVIGVDMTPEMIDKARRNQQKGGFTNVEFRLGEIENLPVADSSADIIISNCVINLSTDKPRVFAEAFRVLRPGGRVMVSDIVLTGKLPEYVMKSVQAYVGCLSGAMLKSDYIGAIKSAGFGEIEVIEETSFPLDDMFNDPTAREIIKSTGKPLAELDRDLGQIVKSVKVSARKPK